jgi:two-component system phosphate regulon response regulator PhoB
MNRRSNTKKNLAPSVLVVEDDEAILSLLSYSLDKAGFIVTLTSDGEEAICLVDEQRPDVILLDWMLPGLTGVQICQRLRGNPDTENIPIIMISARGEEGDRIEGLDRGADDYLVKPFSPRELISRINAVLRRIRPAFASKELEFASLKMNLETHTVLSKEEYIRLSPIEYKILQSLLEHPRRVLSREQILRRVWGIDCDIEPRTVDVHINRLRRVLEASPSNEELYVRTVRSVGYSLYGRNDPDTDGALVSDAEFVWEDEGF